MVSEDMGAASSGPVKLLDAEAMVVLKGGSAVCVWDRIKINTFHASIQVAKSDTVRLGVSCLWDERAVGRD